jgi:excinuclease ABC subunit C
MTFEELKEKAHSLPLKPGVYLMMDKDSTVIYVGKAKALKNRVSQYFQDQLSHTEKTRAMVSQIDHFDTIVAASEFEALVLENSLIKRHMPRYNILLKDSKGYPFIRLTVKERYPKFSLANREKLGDGARYFGPFGGRRDSQNIIDALCIALKLPTCGKTFPRDQGKARPCLNFHMDQCDGYCRAELPQSQHQQAMDQAVRILEGRFGEVERELTAQMEQAAENLEFEKAAALRDRLKAITLLGKRQKVVSGLMADRDVLGLYIGQVRTAVAVLHFRSGELSGREVEFFPTGGESGQEILSAFLLQYYGPRGRLPRQVYLPEPLEGEEELIRFLSREGQEKVELLTPKRGAKLELVRMAQENAREECERVTTKEERTAKILTLLAEKLELAAPPKRIEAYDISNTGASDIVSAMTVFQDGKPRRGAYRCFRIRGLETPDDYASMEQTLRRRFQRDKDADENFGRRPDLLLIDGGDTHAAVAQRVLADFALDIPVFGMVKDERHRTRALVTPQGREIGIQAQPALFAFIGQIQEETHRTAVGFHHKRHSKSTLGSSLEKIPGVGEQRRKALLKHFGSMKAIRAASLDELEQVIPKNAAQAVYQQFRGEAQASPAKKEEGPCA